MLAKLRPLVPSPAIIVALGALAIALGGTAYAATTIGTNQIRDGAVTTPKLHAGAVSAAKLANAAVTGAKLGNGAVTSAKVKDGTLLAKDFKAGELAVGQVQGAQGPPGPQGPAGPAGPAGPGTVGSVILAPEEVAPGASPTLHTVVTVGHARLQAYCQRQPTGLSSVGLFVSASGGNFVVLATRIIGVAPVAAGGSQILEFHGAGQNQLAGDIAVFDKAGPSFRGSYTTYVEAGSAGACMVAVQLGG